MPATQNFSQYNTTSIPLTSFANIACYRGTESPVLDLHKPPSAPDGRKHFVFRDWPRDPNGKPLLVYLISGESCKTLNGFDWGATLLDFYHVRQDDIISTGSRLAATMRNIGELDWAKDEIDWADKEKGPSEVFPCDVSELIRNAEFASGIMEKKDEPVVPSALIGTQAPKLQRRIPSHLLPQKLIVHDDGNVLTVGSWYGNKDSISDVAIRTYSLQSKLPCNTNGATDGEKECMEEAKSDSGHLIKIRLKPKFSGTVTGIPLIIADCPPRPGPQGSVAEAHLYLSSSRTIGSGNHSIVYGAAWELPRSLLVADQLCETCLLEKVVEMLTAMEKSGALTLHGGLSAFDTQIIDAESLAAAPLAGTTLYKPPATAPNLVELTRDLDEVRDADAYSESANEASATEASSGKYNYDGPIIFLKPDVHWQNPERAPYCSHLQPPYQVPLTTKVNVAAKLSFWRDKHLANEAHSYQHFPSHFFEHYNGYNISPEQFKDPFPVGAIVPQFYGYYVPDAIEDPSNNSPPYLSPILLIEHCGVPIQPLSLSIDERKECASLLLRFHHAGWVHNSFAERNVVMQSGPLTEWPASRGVHGKNSFRLIDFGRSKPSEAFSGNGTTYGEMSEALELLYLPGTCR